MSLGETLRLAREEKGQTISQVAEATRMMVQIVEDLEREDFRRIAAPIYGRGFIKLYAEHLGLDPEPAIREFMEIYTGLRPPQIARRTETPLAGGSVEQVNSEAVAPSDGPAAPLPDRPAAQPATRPTVPPSDEPDLFSVAAGRSVAVRSVPDPAQPGETAPPRVRPAPASPETHPSAPLPVETRRDPPKPREEEADGSETEQPECDSAADRLPLQRTSVAIGAMVAAVAIILLLAGGAILRIRKAGKACHAKPAPIRVERVLPPGQPYFE